MVRSEQVASLSLASARAEDFTAIAAITNYYIETTSIHFGYDPCTADDMRTLWEKTRERFPWLVTEDATIDQPSGPVVGYAKAGVWRERNAYAWTCEVGARAEPPPAVAPVAQGAAEI